MNIKSYRSFIREKKREVNKSTKGVKVDNLFEKKVNFLLEGQITTLEFETYLESELYLNVNETYLINESLASNFADKVISKIKSLFNNLYQKLKEDSGFQMIISFFDKVVSGISKFWNFLKKIKAGKLLKKLSITLGITSLASYILAQFGAGWVALMGARMVAATVGKKVGDKVVGESFNIKLYEEFILSKDYYNKTSDNIQEINEFYTKNYTTIDSYYDHIFRNSGSGELYNEFKSRWSQLKVDRKRYKTAFLEFFNWVINNQIVKKSKSTIELESLKWKKKNESKVEIIEKFELLLGVSAKTGLNKEKENVINDIEKKLDGDNKETIEKDKIDNEPIKDDPIDNNKKSIWSKIGGSISKFFKIFRKLKWAIVIFFGVVFILNLIFFPIFEPILQIAQVSSFGTILSDAFEQTANSISSIPNTTTDGVKLNLDVNNKLSDNTEVGKNIQGTIDEVKGNIKGNEELAAKEVNDLVNNMKSNVLYDAQTGEWSDFLQLGEYKYVGKFNFKNPQDEINFFIGLYKDSQDLTKLAKLIDIRDGLLNKELDWGTHNKEDLEKILTDIRGRIDIVFKYEPHKLNEFVSHYVLKGEDVSHYNYFWYGTIPGSGSSNLEIFDKIFGGNDIREVDIFDKTLLKNYSGIKNSLNVDYKGTFNLNFDTLSKSKEESIDKIVSEMRKMIDEMPNKVVINKSVLDGENTFQEFKINKKITDEELINFINDKIRFKEVETKSGSILQQGKIYILKSEFKEFIIKDLDNEQSVEKDLDNEKSAPLIEEGGKLEKASEKVRFFNKIKDKLKL
jgi:hypothetical protein